MHSGRHYTIGEVLRWTGRDAALFAVIATIPTLLCASGLPIPMIPWSPIAVLGTSVAFITGFRGNAAYDRLWEARKIWGGILNESRAFAVHLQSLVDPAGAHEVRPTILRHVAWLTALRYGLRQKRGWESLAVASNRRYREQTYEIPEDNLDVEQEIRERLSADEYDVVQNSRNRTVALLSLHAQALRRLFDAGAIGENRYVELSQRVTAFVDLQGKAERIKNFPYPRQFATLNRMFVWLFILILPWAIAGELQASESGMTFLTIPLMMVVAWVFHTMDKIGSVSENPFEGSPNDVPITAMSRTIEIDMLEVIGEPRLPAPIGPKNQILM